MNTLVSKIDKKTLRILVGIFLVILSLFAIMNHAEILVFAQNIEAVSGGNRLMTFFILILLKGVSAPLGFPGTPLTLLSGSLLGNLLGTITALIGNTLGATMAFLLSRFLLKEYVQKQIISRYSRFSSYEKKLERHPLKTIIALRLIPIFPFNALNFILGVTDISLRSYIFGSFVGMIPGTFLFVYFGESLRMWSITNILLAFFGIAVLTYLGKLYGKSFDESVRADQEKEN